MVNMTLLLSRPPSCSSQTILYTKSRWSLVGRSKDKIGLICSLWKLLRWGGAGLSTLLSGETRWAQGRNQINIFISKTFEVGWGCPSAVLSRKSKDEMFLTAILKCIPNKCDQHKYVFCNSQAILGSTWRRHIAERGPMNKMPCCSPFSAPGLAA